MCAWLAGYSSTTADTLGADTDPKNIRTRRAESGDLEAILGMLSELGEPFAPTDSSGFRQRFSGILDSPSTHILLVAESEGRAVGYTLVTAVERLHSNACSADIQEVVVSKEYRDTGIGSMLVDAAERAVQAIGATELTVATLKNAAFYERLDYRSTADYLKKRFND